MGIEAASISPRPFARARLILQATIAAVEEVGVPVFMASALYILRISLSAPGPIPPVVSNPAGVNPHPTVLHAGPETCSFAFSAAAADECASFFYLGRKNRRAIADLDLW